MTYLIVKGNPELNLYLPDAALTLEGFTKEFLSVASGTGSLDDTKVSDKELKTRKNETFEALLSRAAKTAIEKIDIPLKSEVALGLNSISITLSLTAEYRNSMPISSLYLQ